MTAIFDMGPYAGFIWACYGISFVAIAGMITWCCSAFNAAQARLAALENRK